MMPGTPGFVGERLKEAREAHELSAAALADFLGVTIQSISQYENNKQTPSPQVMRRIQEQLGLPYHFFFAPIAADENDPLFFRSLESASKLVRIKMSRRFVWLRELTRYLGESIQLPKVNFPALDLPKTPAHLSEDQIELAAGEVRKFWNLTDNPISNLIWLIENNGAVVSRQELGTEDLDAFSQWNTNDRRPYFVIGSDKKSAVRSRYNVAHELGHIVLHRHIRSEDLNDKAQFKLIEKQAHYFAGAFILPAETFAADFLCGSTLDRFVSLKPKWKASIQFMVMRCLSLGIINQDQHKRMMINISRRGWRKNEPFDDTIEPEQPRFLRRAVELLVNKKIVDPTEIAFRLRLSDRKIEELAGLESSFLTNSSSNPATSISLDGESENTSDRGNILRFPRFS